MPRRDAFSAINRARTLCDRHDDPGLPDVVKASAVAQVFSVLATFADGDTGRNARPSTARLMAITYLSRPTVTRALARLVDLGEIARTSGAAHRGSAACYTINLESGSVQSRYGHGKAAQQDTESGSAQSHHLQVNQDAPSRPMAAVARPTVVDVAASGQRGHLDAVLSCGHVRQQYARGTVETMAPKLIGNAADCSQCAREAAA